MPSKNWTKIIIGLFSLVILATSFLTGQSIDEQGYKWISTSSSIVIIIVLVFDKWAWRWPIISKVTGLLGHPILYGTWKGTIAFDKDANGKAGSIDCYLSVYQTFSEVQIRGYFGSSQSYSLTAAIERPRAAHTRLVYAYHGAAPYGKRDLNRPNEGTAMLDIIGTPVEELDGSYFTDRGGTGRIRLTKHSNRISQSLSQAKALKYK